MTKRPNGTLTERVARLEERDASTAETLAALKQVIDRLEGRLWWLVTSGAAVGAGAGAAAAHYLT